MITESICKEDPELASHRMKYICVALQVLPSSSQSLGQSSPLEGTPDKNTLSFSHLGIAQSRERDPAQVDFAHFFYFDFSLTFFWINFIFVPDFFHIFSDLSIPDFQKKNFEAHPSHCFLVMKFLKNVYFCRHAGSFVKLNM